MNEGVGDVNRVFGRGCCGYRRCMSVIAWIVVVAAVLAVIGCVVWFVSARKFPEQADSHATGRPPEGETGRGRQPGEVRERPAGPGAESQRPDGHGTMRPGP